MRGGDTHTLRTWLYTGDSASSLSSLFLHVPFGSWGPPTSVSLQLCCGWWHMTKGNNVSSLFEGSLLNVCIRRGAGLSSVAASSRSALNEAYLGTSPRCSVGGRSHSPKPGAILSAVAQPLWLMQAPLLVGAFLLPWVVCVNDHYVLWRGLYLVNNING